MFMVVAVTDVVLTVFTTRAYISKTTNTVVIYCCSFSISNCYVLVLITFASRMYRICIK